MKDLYASEEESNEMIQPDKRTLKQKKADELADKNWMNEQGIEPQRTAAEVKDTNLSCKSTQARLAASWGYVKIEPLTHEQRFDLLTRFEDYKHEWHAHAILIDMVEAAHGIKGDA